MVDIVDTVDIVDIVDEELNCEMREMSSNRRLGRFALARQTLFQRCH